MPPTPPHRTRVGVNQASEASEVSKLLMSTTADVLGALGIPELEPSGLVTASHDQPSYLAFQNLANQRVCSALVWNPTASAWAGFLDLGDYARHLGASRRDAGLACITAAFPRGKLPTRGLGTGLP